MLSFLLSFISCIENICLRLETTRECPIDFTVVQNVEELYPIDSDSFSIFLISKSISIDLTKFKNVKFFGLRSDDNSVISFNGTFAKSLIGVIELSGVTLKISEEECKGKVRFSDRFVFKNSTIDYPQGNKLEISATSILIDASSLKPIKTIYSQNLDIRLSKMLTEDIHIDHMYEQVKFYSQVSVSVPEISSYTFTEEQNSAKIGISGCKYYLYLDYEKQKPMDVRISSNNLPADITFASNIDGYCGSSIWCEFSPSVFLIKNSTVIVNQSFSFYELSGNITLKSTASEGIEISFNKMVSGSSLICTDQKVKVSTPKLTKEMSNIDVASGFYIKEIGNLDMLSESEQQSIRHFSNVKLSAQRISVYLNSKKLFPSISIDNLRLEGDIEVFVMNKDIDVTNKVKYDEVYGKIFNFLKASSITGGSIHAVADPNGGLGFREDDAIYRMGSRNGDYYIEFYVSFDIISPTIYFDSDFKDEIKTLNPMTKTLTIVIDKDGEVLDLGLLPHKVRLTIDGNNHDLQVAEVVSLRSKLFSLNLINISFNIAGTSGTLIDIPIIAKNAGLIGANFNFKDSITIDEESISKWNSPQLGKTTVSLTCDNKITIGNGKADFEHFGTLTASDIYILSNGYTINVERSEGYITPISFFSGKYELIVGSSFDGSTEQPVQIMPNNDGGKINLNLKTKSSPIKFMNYSNSGDMISAFIYTSEKTHNPVIVDDFKLNGKFDIMSNDEQKTSVPVEIRNFTVSAGSNSVFSSQNLAIKNLDLKEGSSLLTTMVTVTNIIKIGDGSDFDPMETTLSNTNILFNTKVNAVPGKISRSLGSNFNNITIKHSTNGVKIDGKYISRWLPLIKLTKDNCDLLLPKIHFTPPSIPVGNNNITFEAECKLYDETSYYLSLIRHVSPVDIEETSTPNDEGDDSSTKSLFYGLLIGGVLLIVLCVAIFIYCYVKRNKDNTNDSNDAIMSQLL